MEAAGPEVTVLVFAVAALGFSVLDLVLCSVDPRALRALACVPVAGSRRFKVHKSHFFGDVAWERPGWYRQHAGKRCERVELVVFPEGIETYQGRVIPLEGGMSAMVVSRAALGGGETMLRIDAVVGPDRTAVALRARVTPFGVELGVVVPLVAGLWFGFAGVICGAFVTAACVVVLVNARRAALRVFDEVEGRLSRRRRKRARFGRVEVR